MKLDHVGVGLASMLLLPAFCKRKDFIVVHREYLLVAAGTGIGYGYAEVVDCIAEFGQDSSAAPAEVVGVVDRYTVGLAGIFGGHEDYAECSA